MFVEPKPKSELPSALQLAVSAGDSAEVVKLLTSGSVDVNYCTYSFPPALQIAVSRGFLELVNILLEYRADVNVIADGGTLLHICAAKGQEPIAHHLLDAGINVEARNKQQMTALQVAALHGHADVCATLLRHGANRDVLTDRGESVLHLAVRSESLDTTKWAVNAGLSVMEKTSYRKSALQMAQDAHCEPIVKWLKRQETRVKDEAKKERMGGDRLLRCVREGDIAGARALCEYGTPISFTGKNNGWNVLHEAAGNGHADAVAWLLTIPDALTLLNSRTRVRLVCLLARPANRGWPQNGWTAAHLAVKGGHVDCLQELVKAGADLSIPLKNGQTLRQLADESGSVAAAAGAFLDALAEEARKAAHSMTPSSNDQSLFNWLQSLDLQSYAEPLAKDGFDTLRRVQEIEEADLEELGMPKGHRRSFMRAISELRGRGSDDRKSDDMRSFTLSNGTGVTSTTDSSASVAGRSAAMNSNSDFSSVSGAPIPEVSDRHELSFAEFKFGDVIGEGSYGVVRRAVWRGMEVAVKELKVVSTGTECSDLQSTQRELRHEAEMMQRVCNHDNVVQFIGVIVTPRPAVVTKFMTRGSLEELVAADGSKSMRATLSWRELLQAAISVAAGVLHLHHEHVIHRDLACRNVLVDEHFGVRVADFGFSRVKAANHSKGYTRTATGPIKWMAPEALRYREYSEASDVFSFGVVLYEIASGRRPWQDQDNMDVVVRVCNGERMSLDGVQNQAIVSLIRRCWAHKAAERPTMSQVHAELLQQLADLDKADPEGPSSGRPARFGSPYISSVPEPAAGAPPLLSLDEVSIDTHKNQDNVVPPTVPQPAQPPIPPRTFSRPPESARVLPVQARRPRPIAAPAPAPAPSPAAAATAAAVPASADARMMTAATATPAAATATPGIAGPPSAPVFGSAWASGRTPVSVYTSITPSPRQPMLVAAPAPAPAVPLRSTGAPAVALAGPRGPPGPSGPPHAVGAAGPAGPPGPSGPPTAARVASGTPRGAVPTPNAGRGGYTAFPRR